MSFIATIQTKEHGTVILSPSVKPYTTTDTAQSSSEDADDDAIPSVSQTSSDLYRWTFNKSAVAPCFIKDIFEMKESGDITFDFFWLGRVPCRTVEIVGLVVGVQQYESNTRYTVDDGTAVIDCMYRHAPPATPKKRRKKEEGAQQQNGLNAEGGSIPQPVAAVGDSVRFQGRVTRLRDSRYVKVDYGDLSLCSSVNEEPQHWMNIIDLHKTHYDIYEPFLIPEEPVRTTLTQTSAVTAEQIPVPATPSTVGTASPSKDEPSPVKGAAVSKSPLRLRHPSRLHSRDLTDITFSIYVKYYMDNATPNQPLPHLHQQPPDKTIDSLFNPTDACPLTPTPADRRRREIMESPTPRRQQNLYSELKTTVDYQHDIHLGSLEPLIEYGYTLSYLRRIPELALLAKRVVEAEKRRRERETRRLAREAEKAPKSVPSRGPLKAEKAGTFSETIAKKVKRLYIKTIRDLYSEGKIIIWDGPVRDWSSASRIGDITLPWKSTLSSEGNSTSMSSISVVSALNSIASQIEGSDAIPDDISEPGENEEAYVPVTDRRIAVVVEETMIKLKGRNKASRTKHFGVDEILKALHSDARWGNVGEWAVEDALELMKNEDKVYKVGSARWALCL